MTEPVRPADRHQTHYPLFDYLRILLAIGVFMQHALAGKYLPGPFGNACVQVFFALSGFLIGTILLNSQMASLPRFYFKRVVRIWIPYAIAVVLLMTFTLLRQDLHDPLLWQSAFYNATFVTNIFRPPMDLQWRTPMWGSAGHFWSICVEEQFYLLAPLVMVLLRGVRVPILVAVIVLNLFVPHDFAAISLGVVLAIAAAKWPISWPVNAACAGLAALALLAAFRGWVSYSAMAPVGAVAVVAALARPGRVNPVGTVLGGMSYPFYLNHWIPLLFRPGISALLGISAFASIWVALLATLGLSAVHYVFVDRPVLEARDGWYSSARGAKAWACGFAVVAVGLAVGTYIHLQFPLAAGVASIPSE